MSLCPPCQAEWLRWLDYRPPGPIKITQSGSPRWNVPHGARVLETIKSQQALITARCGQAGHSLTPSGPAPPADPPTTGTRARTGRRGRRGG